MSKNYTGRGTERRRERGSKKERSSFSKLVFVFFFLGQKKYENCNIYSTHTTYTNACVCGRECVCDVCVRHLNGKAAKAAAAAAVDLKFFYHICQIRIYVSLLCFTDV